MMDALVAGSLMPSAAGLLGWLTRESVYAGVVFLIVAVCSWLLRRRGPELHHALWWLVLVRLVLPVDLSHPLTIGRLLELGAGDVPAVFSAASQGAAVEIDAGVMTPVHGGTLVGGLASSWPVLLVWVWAVGAVLVAFRTIRRRRVVRQIVRNSVPIASADLMARCEAWRHRLSVRRTVSFVATDERCSPFTVGVRRPVIVLPDRMLDSPRTCEAAIAHEMVHVAKLDALWLGIQRLLHCVYFFHPLAWLAGSRIDFERERCCDATVVAFGVMSPRQYATALVDVAGLGVQENPALSLVRPVRRLTMRISSILGNQRTTMVSRIGSLMCVVFLGAVCLPMASSESPSGGPVPAAPLPMVETTEAELVAGSAEAQVEAEIRLTEPVPGARLTLGWGQARHPFKNGEFFHRGLDLAAPKGTEVVAAASGSVQKVLVSYGDASTGRYVVLAHDGGYSTYYGHLGEILVEEGQRVVAGAPIATVGLTGLTTGPHVHFELRSGKARIDPAPMIEPGW